MTDEAELHNWSSQAELGKKITSACTLYTHPSRLESERIKMDSGLFILEPRLPGGRLSTEVHNTYDKQLSVPYLVDDPIWKSIGSTSTRSIR